MKITAQEEYGLRCLLQLARHEGPEPLTVSAIAEAEGLSVPYVSKLLATLRQGGLVESVRGRGGGYALSRTPAEITVAQALTGLGGHLFEPEFCDTHNGTSEVCVHLDRCSIRTLWSVLGRLVDRVLERTTLADLLDAAQPCRSLEVSEIELARIAAPMARGGKAPA